MSIKKEFIEGVHYYLQNGMVIMTEKYHKQRGFCCGNGCKHCCYEPKHIKNNKKLSDNNKD
jgi:hypothetical protein